MEVHESGKENNRKSSWEQKHEEKDRFLSGWRTR
jgi:hypothetical protein